MFLHMKYTNIRTLVCLFAIGFAFHTCKTESPKPATLSQEQLEILEDSLEFVAARTKQSKITLVLTADAETSSVTSPGVDDDAADDIAIWVNRNNPERSTIIGTNKKGGVVVFNLQGEEMAFYPTGRINNIDVMMDYPMGKKKIDLVGCTNRSDQSIDLFQINPADGSLSDIAVDALKIDTNLVKDVYGFCFYHSEKPYLFVNGKNGAVLQFEIVTAPKGKLGLKLVRSVKLDSQTEGMVADEATGILYIGEEDKGIWKLSAEPDGSDSRTLLAMSGEDNPNIAYDVEGLALYKKDSTGFLIVSSQGNFSYAVFERLGDNRYVGSFKIMDSDTIDGVEETDGIDIVSIPVGNSFPKGMFMAQDGFNFDRGKIQRQNFKMLRWEKIEALFGKN